MQCGENFDGLMIKRLVASCSFILQAATRKRAGRCFSKLRPQADAMRLANRMIPQAFVSGTLSNADRFTHKFDVIRSRAQ